MKGAYQTYDCFVGKIAPFLLFEIEYHNLFGVVESHKGDRFYSEINPASQVASIGLLSYFEAFCKHQFAAILNILPSLAKTFCRKRGEPKIEFSTITSLNGEFQRNIGFALGEVYDFGTAKNINAIFRDLLLITPFNKEEESKFNEIVYKRNLLVHHGGFYTLQFLKGQGFSEDFQRQAFRGAVKIDTEDYHEISDFLFEMAMKIARATVKALRSVPEYMSIAEDDERVLMVEELLRGLHDYLEVE
jgi:hypothetical protein